MHVLYSHLFFKWLVKACILHANHIIKVQVSHKFNVTCMQHTRVHVSHTLHNAMSQRAMQWHTCMIWWVYICCDLSIAIIVYCHIIRTYSNITALTYIRSSDFQGAQNKMSYYIYSCNPIPLHDRCTDKVYLKCDFFQ